jgi:hypothetical protein
VQAQDIPTLLLRVNGFGRPPRERRSVLFEELLRDQTDVFGDLAKQGR